jgi:hypothetical protein
MMRKVLMAKAGTSLAAGQQRSRANMHPPVLLLNRLFWSSRYRERNL